jgi:hypothetical protein
VLYARGTLSDEMTGSGGTRNGGVESSRSTAAWKSWDSGIERTLLGSGSTTFCLGQKRLLLRRREVLFEGYRGRGVSIQSRG